MNVWKFLCRGQLCSSRVKCAVPVKNRLIVVRYYADDKKCNEVKTKHRLVPCQENDAVSLCIEEPLQLGPAAKTPATCDKNTFRVIILGAGLAGLFAGARLAKTGLEDFVILEAKDRPGGRIETCKLGSSLVELGAEFIQGASIANAVYQFACMNGLITDSSPKVEYQGGLFLFSDSRAVEASPKVLKAFQRTLDELPVEATKESEASRNVFDHIEDKMKKEIYKYNDWEIDDSMRQAYSLMNDLRADLGIDLGSITVKNYGSRLITPGLRLRFDKGAASLVSSLLKQIPKEKVICKKAIQTVWWCQGTDGVRVRCCDGEEYRACHVIVTASLGALRTQSCLFCPPLPSEKIEAIRDIPFGKAAKLFLRYKEPFWLDHGLTMRFGWLKEELKDRQDWIKGIGVMEELPSTTDRILRVTIGGRESRCVEGCKEAGMDLFYWLNSIIGTSLPLPTEVVSSKWNSDIFIGGSASFNAPDFQRILAEPLPNRKCPTLLFAGEATIPGYVGSMQSAAKSGITVADQILEVIKIYSEGNEKAMKEYEKELAEYDKKHEQVASCE